MFALMLVMLPTLVWAQNLTNETINMTSINVTDINMTSINVTNMTLDNMTNITLGNVTNNVTNLTTEIGTTSTTEATTTTTTTSTTSTTVEEKATLPLPSNLKTIGMIIVIAVGVIFVTAALIYYLMFRGRDYNIDKHMDTKGKDITDTEVDEYLKKI